MHSRKVVRDNDKCQYNIVHNVLFTAVLTKLLSRIEFLTVEHLMHRITNKNSESGIANSWLLVAAVAGTRVSSTTWSTRAGGATLRWVARWRSSPGSVSSPAAPDSGNPGLETSLMTVLLLPFSSWATLTSVFSNTVFYLSPTFTLLVTTTGFFSEPSNFG